MTVRELREKLAKCDQDTDVVCYCEDEQLKKGKGVIVLDIVEVDVTQAERARISGVPTVKFGSNQNAAPIVILTVTADF
jgi:hypothetical protein